MESFSLCSFIHPCLSSGETIAFMPHHSPRWPEIKAVLSRIAATCRNIFHLVSLFDYLEHLVNLGPPSTALLQLIPSRETFIGLGNYLFYHTAEEQRNFFFASLLPKILNYAIEIENVFLTTPLAYSRAYEEFAVSIPRSHVASLIACSFLCLYPNAERQNCLFSDVNFTYFFHGITSESTAQVAKLQAILQYFACLSEPEGMPSQPSPAFRIMRRSLRLKTFNNGNQASVGEAQSLLPFNGRQFVDALRGTRLPLALVENTCDKETVSEMFDLPLIDFVNSYVGGGALRASELSSKSVYFRYPETLVALALCCRLEGPEALWIDNYLGPFGASAEDPLEEAKPRTFRRLVVANSTRFPVWASELQYSEAGIIDDIVKTTAGLFQVDLDNEEIAASGLPPPFSPEWWLQHSSQSLTELDDIPPLRMKCQLVDGANLASTREARALDRFARLLSKVTLKEALQASRRCPVPSWPHHDHRSPLMCTLASSRTSLGRCPQYRQEPPVAASSASFSFQNPTKRPGPNIPSRSLKPDGSLRDSGSGTSFGAELDGLPGKFAETVGLLASEVMSDAIDTVRKRLRGIYEVSDNLTKSLLKECLTPSMNARDPTFPKNIPLRHLRPLTVDIQPQTLDTTQPLPRRPVTKTNLLTPSHAHTVNPSGIRTTYSEHLINFSVSLASRCLLSALLQLRRDFIRSHSSTTPDPCSKDQSSEDAAKKSEGVLRNKTDRPAQRPSGFVTGPLVCGVDPQVNIMIQWISAAVASSIQRSNSASPATPLTSQPLESPQDPVARRSRSYLSPVVFATHGNPKLQQLHAILNAIGAAGWNADHLLRSLLEYSDYRSRLLSGGPSSPQIAAGHDDAPPSAPPFNPPLRVLSLFDFLLSRFSDRTARTLPI
ncbi:hypothetical protein SprV_0100050900 [Sparganum proliferum]